MEIICLITQNDEMYNIHNKVPFFVCPQINGKANYVYIFYEFDEFDISGIITIIIRTRMRTATRQDSFI